MGAVEAAAIHQYHFGCRRRATLKTSSLGTWRACAAQPVPVSQYHQPETDGQTAPAYTAGSTKGRCGAHIIGHLDQPAHEYHSTAAMQPPKSSDLPAAAPPPPPPTPAAQRPTTAAAADTNHRRVPPPRRRGSPLVGRTPFISCSHPHVGCSPRIGCSHPAAAAGTSTAPALSSAAPP